MSIESTPAGPLGSQTSGTPNEPISLPGFFPPELILKQLSAVRTTQPVAALASANQHRAALTDAFLAAMERGLADPRENFEKDGMLFNYAAYFLAQWREPRACPLFLQWFSLPGEDALDLGGDTVTQDGARFLASVCGSQVEAIKALVQNRDANPFCRGQALTALGVLTTWKEWPREQLESYLSFLAREGLERTPHQVWSNFAALVMSLELMPLFPELRRARQDALIDEQMLRLEDIDELERAPRGAMIGHFTARYHPISDVARETRWWAGFQGQNPNAPGGAAHTGAPYVAPDKTGRNDPCPCGSGKKFKKCCGQSA